MNDNTAILSLGSLDYQQVMDLKTWCENATRCGGPLYKKYEEAENASRAATMTRRDLLKKKKETGLPRVEAWLHANLTPGRWLKMRGCRDGHGYRQFIRWDGNFLVCWQLHVSFHKDKETGHRSQRFKVGNQVTSHMTDKVQQVNNRSSGLWEQIGKLI